VLLLFSNLMLGVDGEVEVVTYLDSHITVGPRRVTVVSLCDTLQRQLGQVTANPLWSTDELEEYITEGYNALVMTTGCLWATDVAPDSAYAFNYTSRFESDYFVGGDVVSGLAQFTSECERDFNDNGSGPANHNFHWEHNHAHTTDAELPTEISALHDLPENLYDIERAVWQTRRIAAERSRHFEGDDHRYELSKGPVDAYLQDKDGLRRLRKWRVPAAPYDPYDVDEDSEEYGILVSIADTEIDDDTPQGAQSGDFVQVAGQHMMGDPWGVIVAIYKETANMRYEYRRRGTGDCTELEIPARYQTYVRHYAQARALEREGDGQDLELAAHYQARYEAGVARMLKRRSSMHYQQKYVLGGGRRPETRPVLRLPYSYGRAVR
jgi:hypothetical protein